MLANPTDRSYQASEQRYRHLFEYAPICIFVVDLTQTPATILEANRRAVQVYGYPAAELVGMPAVHLAPEEARSTALSILQRVEQGYPVTAEIPHQHHDGTRFPVRLIAALDPTDASHMLITVEDITAGVQRRSEAEAIDAERRRIAQEIHDGVAQSLAGLRFKSALWYRLADTDPVAMHAALDELQAELNAAIVAIRHAIFALRPIDLDTLGFMPALTQWVADFSDQNQLVTQLDLSGEPDRLPSVYELPLFRIIQEGLNNIGQHAHSSLAQVRLGVDAAGGVILSVRDNGCGFDSSQLRPVDRNRHFGLRQMRERILDLHGSLDIHSVIGQGTELVISLPSVTSEANYATD